MARTLSNKQNSQLIYPQLSKKNLAHISVVVLVKSCYSLGQKVIFYENYKPVSLKGGQAWLGTALILSDEGGCLGWP